MQHLHHLHVLTSGPVCRSCETCAHGHASPSQTLRTLFGPVLLVSINTTRMPLRTGAAHTGQMIAPFPQGSVARDQCLDVFLWPLRARFLLWIRPHVSHSGPCFHAPFASEEIHHLDRPLPHTPRIPHGAVRHQRIQSCQGITHDCVDYG